MSEAQTLVEDYTESLMKRIHRYTWLQRVVNCLCIEVNDMRVVIAKLKNEAEERSLKVKLCGIETTRLRPRSAIRRVYPLFAGKLSLIDNRKRLQGVFKQLISAKSRTVSLLQLYVKIEERTELYFERFLRQRGRSTTLLCIAQELRSRVMNRTEQSPMGLNSEHPEVAFDDTMYHIFLSEPLIGIRLCIQYEELSTMTALAEKCNLLDKKVF